ncbi:hypothetical protein ACFV98_30305 [Streptomyces violascens]|uniref:hypothetical protein n=1 Tax=Streptomyces violascens TaxID=67381 RepID=UPI00364A8F97
MLPVRLRGEPAVPEPPRSPAARLTVPAPAPITLRLPDGQEIERVRLYERQQLDSGLWMYRIGVPLWQTARNAMNCTGCNTRLGNQPVIAAG